MSISQASSVSNVTSPTLIRHGNGAPTRTCAKSHPVVPAQGKGFCKIEKEAITRIEYLLKSRRRRCLGYKTPSEGAASSIAPRYLIRVRKACAFFLELPNY
jgi:hypothetical protein